MTRAGVYMTKSIDEILAITEPAAFADAIIAFVNDKQIAHSFESLTATEKIVLLACDCSYRLVRGGLLDPLFNPGREWRDAMLAALHEIGATHAERILGTAATLVDAIPEEQARRADTLGDVMTLAGEDKLEALSQELRSSGAQAQIDRQLFSYIVQHRARFRTVTGTNDSTCS